MVDAFGEHMLTCQRAAGFVKRRHDAIAQCLARNIKYAGVEAKVEVTNLLDRTLKRPADVWATRWGRYDGGMAIDVTVVSRGVTSVEEAAAAKERKYAEYFEGLQSTGFTPCAFDLCGGVEWRAAGLLDKIASMQALYQDNHTDYPTARKEVWGSVAWTFVEQVTFGIVRGSDSATRRVATGKPSSRQGVHGVPHPHAGPAVGGGGGMHAGASPPSPPPVKHRRLRGGGAILGECVSMDGVICPCARAN